jgi:spore coat protein CotH
VSLLLPASVSAQAVQPGDAGGRNAAGPEGRGGRDGGLGRGNGERPIVAQFDLDKDGRLNTAERATAAEFIKANPVGRGRRGGGGGRGGGGRGGGGRGGSRPLASPGEKLTPADVKNFPDAPLYDATVLRTFFIELENPNWEEELVTFNNTDVEVPAAVTVDGRTYPDVGIHFRGNSSFGVGNGYKRSLNLTFDFVHKDQAVLGYRTLNFLNSNGDPTFLRTIVSLHIARQYIPAPQANLVRVVINGENWGIYANAQQFNKDFIKENFQTTGGTRWKVPQGGGGGIGAFRYVDENVDSYKGVFQIKSKEQPEAWAALIKLARTLKDTSTEELEAALAPQLDIDGYLRFLALDNAMANGDGFYTRGADYSLYLHPDGRFHLIFYDVNEMFSSGGGGRGRGGGGGGGGGRGGGGTSLSPLATQDDASKPIIARILAVPSLRAKYLAYVRQIAEKSFDWQTLGPVVKGYRDLISDDVARDTRKLFSTEQFLAAIADEPSAGSLRNFIDQRRAFLLNWSEPAATEESQ